MTSTLKFNLHNGSQESVMAQHDNLHRNQRTRDQAAASAAEGGRSSSGFSTAEGVAGYVEGPFGEDLKNSQVGARKSGIGIGPRGETLRTPDGLDASDDLTPIAAGAAPVTGDKGVPMDREQGTARDMTESLGRAAAPPSETWSDSGRGTGELGAEQVDSKPLPDPAATKRATPDR